METPGEIEACRHEASLDWFWSSCGLNKSLKDYIPTNHICICFQTQLTSSFKKSSLPTVSNKALKITATSDHFLLPTVPAPVEWCQRMGCLWLWRRPVGTPPLGAEAYNIFIWQNHEITKVLHTFRKRSIMWGATFFYKHVYLTRLNLKGSTQSQGPIRSVNSPLCAMLVLVFLTFLAKNMKPW